MYQNLCRGGTGYNIGSGLSENRVSSEKESSIHSSEDWVEKLWDICVRTLGNCMLETYMDCPYYEQLQFAMDTRLEALFTYAVSSDSALARKALIDFHYGMQPEGLTAGKYPSVYLQILSTFSLHYIYMLWEYYKQTGDKETLRLCRGDIDRILDYYDIHIGKMDWLEAWNSGSLWTGIRAGLTAEEHRVLYSMVHPQLSTLCMHMHFSAVFSYLKQPDVRD